MSSQRTDGWKQALYPVVYLKNVVKYSRRKVKLSFLEVWVGQRCTLRCRDCLHMIPYVEPRVYDIEALIADCRKLFQLCEVDFISILGGEPFTNRKLYQFLDFIRDCPGIRDGKLITNGTVLPDERTLRSLIDLEGKLDVHIDVYPGSEERSRRFYQVMQENHIRCAYLRHEVFEELHWKWMGRINQRRKDRHTSQVLFTHCGLRGCYTLADGEFTVCPRGITTESVFHMPKNPYEHIDMKKVPVNVWGRAWFATCIDPGIYKDYCRYCLGETRLNPFWMYAGIQLPKRGRKEGKSGDRSGQNI